MMLVTPAWKIIYIQSCKYSTKYVPMSGQAPLKIEMFHALIVSTTAASEWQQWNTTILIK